MCSFCEAFIASRHDHCEPTVFVRIGFGMFVQKDERRVIEHAAIALGDGLQLGDEIRELLNMPFANIPKDPLSFYSVRSCRFAFGMCVVVVTSGSVPEPGEAGDALTLR